MVGTAALEIFATRVLALKLLIVALGDVMPLKKKPPYNLADQSARFIEAGKKAESKLSGKAFEKAFKKIVPPKSNTPRYHFACSK